MNWYVDAWKKCVEFSGRARRKAFWMFVLFNFLISFGIGMIGGVIGNDMLSLVYSLAIFLPSLALSIRRLHDTGHSGWWILVPIVPIVFLFLDSTPGENSYGPNPKEVKGSAA